MSYRACFLVFFFVLRAAYSTQCPQSSKEWETKLDRLARSITPKLGINAVYKRGPKLLPAKAYQVVLDFWEACSPKASPTVANRYKNLLRHSRFMVKAQAQGHSGFAIPDRDYLLQSLSTNPSFAELPKVFLREGYLPENWEATLKGCASASDSDLCKRIKSWRILDFYSTLEDGSGKHRRVIIQIPKKHFQQFLLFFPEHDEHRRTKLVDIIALQTHDLTTGKSLKSKRPFFFERTKRGFAADGGRCFTCHPSGLRQVRPMQGTVTDAFMAKRISEFNQELRTYTSIDWQGLVDVSALGPPMGGVCLRCHGKERGPLTIFTKPSLIRSKVHELEMPFPWLYQGYFEALNAFTDSENVDLKRQLKQFVLKELAPADGDYRAKESVRNTRKGIYRFLRRTDLFPWYRFYSMRVLEPILTVHMDYTMKHFFSNHEKKMQQWLMGRR